MKPSLLLLPALALLALPAQAQCGPGHHGFQRPSGHAGHQESAPTKKVQATNTLCPVMGQPVQPGRDREVVVRGNHYLVCCDGCGPEMAEHYDKYLDPEGRPLNDPARKDPAPAQPPAPGHTGHARP